MSLTRDDVLKLLRDARDQNATEIHFKVPNRPLMRIDEALLPIGTIQITPATTMQVAQILCSLANLELPLNSIVEREFSFGLNGVGRFTVQIYRQRGSVALLVHRNELTIPNLSELGFHADAERLLERPGIILCAGLRKRPAIIASLVDRFNASQRGFVAVLEERISYLHRDAMAAIAQRSVGADMESMEAGLKAAIRQLPDLLAVGEVPNRNCAEHVLEAAEHGVRVLVGITATTTNDAIASFLRQFPIQERSDADARLRRHLLGILIRPDHGDAIFDPTAIV